MPGVGDRVTVGIMGEEVELRRGIDAGVIWGKVDLHLECFCKNRAVGDTGVVELLDRCDSAKAVNMVFDEVTCWQTECIGLEHPTLEFRIGTLLKPAPLVKESSVTAAKFLDVKIIACHSFFIPI